MHDLHRNMRHVRPPRCGTPRGSRTGLPVGRAARASPEGGGAGSTNMPPNSHMYLFGCCPSSASMSWPETNCREACKSFSGMLGGWNISSIIFLAPGPMEMSASKWRDRRKGVAAVRVARSPCTNLLTYGPKPRTVVNPHPAYPPPYPPPQPPSYPPNPPCHRKH